MKQTSGNYGVIKRRCSCRLLLISVWACQSLSLAAQPVAGYYEFSGWEIVRYYFYLWLTRFADYPFVIRTAYFIILFSAVVMAVAILMGIIRNFSLRRRRRYYKKIVRKCGDALHDVAFSAERASDSDLSEAFRPMYRPGRNLKRWQSMQWMYFFVSLKKKGGLSPEAGAEVLNEENFHRCLDYMQLENFIAHALQYGGNYWRIKVIRLSGFLDLRVPDHIIMSLTDSKDILLRKMARIYHANVTVESPFRLMMSPGGKYSSFYQMVVHDIYENRKSRGMHVPNVMYLVRNSTNAVAKAAFIREAAIYASDKDIDGLHDLFLDKDEAVRLAIVETVGKRRRATVEDDMVGSFKFQSLTVQKAIINAVKSIASGRQAGFLSQVADLTSSSVIRCEALACLLHYGQEGQAEFARLRAAATGQERALLDSISGLGTTASVETDARG